MACHIGPITYKQYSAPADNRTTMQVAYSDLIALRAILKVGDTISARWIVANNNQYVSDAGLRTDTASVCIQRGEGLKRREIELQVGSVTVPASGVFCHV